MADENLADIVTQVGVAARQFKAVIELAKVVDDVSKIDQLRSEAEQRLGAVRREEASLQDVMDGLAKRVEALNGEIDRSKGKADQIVAEAMRQAGAIQRKAEADAQATRDKAAADMAAAANDAKSRLTAVEDAIAERAKAAEEAKAAAADAKAELAAVTSQLNEARVAVQKLLGV